MGGTAGQSIEQPTELMAMEGAIAQVNCTYQISGFNGLSWYQQHDGKAPIFLSYNVLDGLERRGPFSSFLSRSDGYSYLLLQELHIKDSASYFCAVRDTVTVRPLQLHQNSKGNCSSEKSYFLSVCLLSVKSGDFGSRLPGF
ncbi:T-cell receptor alpha chain V region 2B4 [Tupaia chinensis]|nr:T-cell receptor alpha chain V region 2B4 [Tupaia chinensis]